MGTEHGWSGSQSSHRWKEGTRDEALWTSAWGAIVWWPSNECRPTCFVPVLPLNDQMKSSDLCQPLPTLCWRKTSNNGVKFSWHFPLVIDATDTTNGKNVIRWTVIKWTFSLSTFAVLCLLVKPSTQEKKTHRYLLSTQPESGYS